MKEKVKSFLCMIYHTLKPFWDFRVLLLVGSCIGLSVIIDPIGTIQFLSFCLYVSGFWGIAILIAKVLRPKHKNSELLNKALEDPLASSVIYCSHIILRIAVAFSYILWWAWR